MPYAGVPDLIRRIDDTLKQSAGRFPMYADPTSGEWAWSDDGGWLGGFWPGLLWLAGAATGEATYARAAVDASGRLGPRTTSPTVLRGFLFWYGAGLGSELGQAGENTAGSAIDAARSLCKDVDPVAHLLSPGDEDVSLYDWPRPGACIDGLPGTVRLLAFASERTGDPTFRTIALAHARGHHKMCVRADGSVAQSATYDDTGELSGQNSINGSSPRSTWARSQTWAMLGLAQAAHLSAEFTRPATEVADWYLRHVPEDLVCYWDFGDPSIPHTARDTSATAIAAAALAKLAPLAGDRYRTAAENTLTALITTHVSAHGALIDGCLNHRKGVATRNELVWGDYFMMEAALTLDGVVDSTRL